MADDRGELTCACSRLIGDLWRDRARLLAHVGYTEAAWAERGGVCFDVTVMPVVCTDALLYIEPPPLLEEVLVLPSKVEDALPHIESPPLFEVPALPPEVSVPRIELLSTLNPCGFTEAPAPVGSMVWTEEQETALREIDDWYSGDGRFFALTGPAGVGKSTVLRAVHDRYDPVLTAMTGKAALRLEQVTGAGASTLHKLMYYPPRAGEDVRFDRLRDPPQTLVVVDESSMMTPAVFADLKRWGVRVLFVGDVFQLPPVITGEELKEHGEDYTVFSQVSGTSLQTVMRNAGGVLRAATRVRTTGQICRVSDLDGPENGYEYLVCGNPVERAVEEYLADLDDHLLIFWKNATRMRANRIIRERLGHDGPLPDEGEPVLIKKNGQGHLNGEVVTCGIFTSGPTVGSMRTLWMTVQGSSSERLLVSFEGGNPERGGEFFDGQAPWVTDWRVYNIDLKTKVLPEPIPITWGYAFTCHSVQGSQGRRSTIVLERGDDRSRYFNKTTTLPTGEMVPFSARWCYTAQTRSQIYTKMIVG